MSKSGHVMSMTRTSNYPWKTCLSEWKMKRLSGCAQVLLYEKFGHRSTQFKGQKRFANICKGKHDIDKCSQFLVMSVGKRQELVKQQKACFSYLKRSKGHTATNCLRKKECQEKKLDGNSCKKIPELLHNSGGSRSKSEKIREFQFKMQNTPSTIYFLQKC